MPSARAVSEWTPVSGRYLLDTNIVIALFAGEPSVRRHLERESILFLPSVVIGELYYGALASGRKAANLQRIEELVRVSDVLVCDAQTARSYGDVKLLLREKGRPIPENDVWIGAIAAQHGLILASRDTHFDDIPGLAREAW